MLLNDVVAWVQRTYLLLTRRWILLFDHRRIISFPWWFLHYSFKICELLELDSSYSLRLVGFHAHGDYFLDLWWKLWTHSFVTYRNGNMVFQLGLGPTVSVGCLTVQEFVDQDTECPYVCFRTIDIVNKSFGGHVNGRSNIDIFKILSELGDKYLVNLANPKSAIFALPLCKNTLATFKSRWITFFFAR